MRRGPEERRAELRERAEQLRWYAKQLYRTSEPLSASVRLRMAEYLAACARDYEHRGGRSRRAVRKPLAGDSVEAQLSRWLGDAGGS